MDSRGEGLCRAGASNDVPAPQRRVVLTRLLQQLIYKIHSAAASSAVVGSILLVSFPSPSSTGGEGKATSSRAHLCLYFVT